MNIFLKILIVLNLLLAIVAVVFVYFMHEQREILKTQIGEARTHVKDMAKSLRWGEYDNLEADIARKGNFGLLGTWQAEPKGHPQKMVNNMVDYQQMRVGLNAMEKVAANRVESLIESKLQWDELDGRLEETNRVLNATRVTLADTEQKLEDEEQAHIDTKRQLEDERETVRKQKGEIEGLNGEIADLNENIEKKNEAIAKYQSDLDEVNAEAFDLKRQLEICKRGGDGIIVAEDQVGKVIAVEHDWNFIVMDIGTENSVTEKMTAMIHRGDDLIGRVEISKATQDTSIGIIIPEFKVKGYRIEVGDGVMF